MSLIFKKLLQANLPSTDANNTITFTNEGNLFITKADQSQLKIGDVITVTSLPTNGLANKIYVLNDNGSFSIHTWTGSAWEEIVSSDGLTIADKGVANGVAILDENGKVPTSQLPNSVMGGLNYKGTFGTTSGDLSSTALAGDYYICEENGYISKAAKITFDNGDWAVFNGTTYDKIDNTDKVNSVNGKTGTITITTNDVAEDSTSKYFTDQRAQDAIGTIITDTTTVSIAYDKKSHTLSADVKDGSLGVNKFVTASLAKGSTDNDSITTKGYVDEAINFVTSEF